MQTVSDKDKDNLSKIRENVRQFMIRSASTYDAPGLLLLDIAPQDHEGAAPFFVKAKTETLDIDSSSGATYIADLCTDNSGAIPSEHFDFVVCTEVLEHTLQPFSAANEIFRILKKGGYAFISTPYDFRIHGPLPDCWRFTEHGLRALFKDFEEVELKSLEQEDRFLMPLHYTFVVKKPNV